MKNKNILENLAAVTAGKVKTSGVSAFNELEISKVFPNPDQPRKQFDDIEELAATIKEHGLLQPITVVKKDDRYMIIAGERRYKAHLHNEAKTIKAYIVDVSEEQVEELTLIENIQRNDLTDFELAKHICKLWDSGRYEKKSDLATRIGKSDSYVSKSFNCLKLDSEIIDHIEQNKTPISISVMDEIARVKDPVVQKEVYEKYNNKEITRDEIKEFKKEENSPREIFNETFTFSKHGWTNMFFGYIKQDWIFKRLKDNEHYELKIKEISTFSDDIKDEKREISFTLEMTKNFKDSFKSMFDHWSFAKCKFLEVGKYYKVTIRPNGKVYALSFKDPDYDKNRLDETAALKQKIKELEKEIEELNDKEVFIVGYREKKGSAIGSGFRCRALNENEAIEIAIKENYHNLANDKNIIWEARTLKSSCNNENMSDYVSYGFGTVNDIGTYIAVCDGDFEGTITFEKGGEFVKTTHNREYKVIIKEIDTPVEKPKEIKEPKKVTKSLKDEKGIALLELFGDFVTINYTDYDIDMGIDYKQAKKIIDKSKQDYIPFNVFNGTDERAYKLIDEDVRTVKDNHIVLIPSS